MENNKSNAIFEDASVTATTTNTPVYVSDTGEESYRNRERRSYRLNTLIQPSLHEELVTKSKERGVSVTEILIRSIRVGLSLIDKEDTTAKDEQAVPVETEEAQDINAVPVTDSQKSAKLRASLEEEFVDSVLTFSNEDFKDLRETSSSVEKAKMLIPLCNALTATESEITRRQEDIKAWETRKTKLSKAMDAFFS